MNGTIRTRRRIDWGAVARHAVLLCFALVVLLPLAWVVLLSLKSLPDAYDAKPWPNTFDFSHYGEVLTRVKTLPRNFLNTILVTGGTVLLATTSAVLAGFALVHLPMRGRAVVLGLLVASMFFPTRITALVAIYEIQKKLGLFNTTWGLILPYSSLTLAVSVFIMRGIFETVPKDLADAARIDGCGPWSLFWRVMLPMASNGIVVVAILNFISAWGEYLLASTLTLDQETRTLPVLLASVSGGQGQWDWPRLAAAYVLAIVPALAAFAFSQRWYMKGLQEGALKG